MLDKLKDNITAFFAVIGVVGTIGAGFTVYGTMNEKIAQLESAVGESKPVNPDGLIQEIAKNRKFAQLFTSLFRIRKIHKTYLALVYGKVNNSIKTINDDLVYYENNKKITQKAISNLRVIKSNEGYSYLELNPITGRKHQLRRQLLNIGSPIVGDDKYFLNDRKRIKNKNLMLHAYKIKFMINNIQYNFKANYNNLFEEFLKKNF